MFIFCQRYNHIRRCHRRRCRQCLVFDKKVQYKARLEVLDLFLIELVDNKVGDTYCCNSDENISVNVGRDVTDTIGSALRLNKNKNKMLSQRLNQ